jgi:hypothetical protein
MSTEAPATWRTHRARVAALSRSRVATDPDLIAAHRQLKAERLADYIARTVDAAPPLTDEQRQRLAALLTPRQVGAAGPDAAA